MSEPDDLLRKISEGDQSVAAMTQFASLTALYFNELRRRGLERGEALRLTLQWQESALKGKQE